MTAPYFMDTVLKRYTYTDTDAGVYGEPIKKYIYADNINVDFQNENNQELAKVYGVELQNLYKIYAPLNAPLNDTDRLEDADGNTYHIIGQIQKYIKFHKYKKAHIIRNRSPRNINTGSG